MTGLTVTRCDSAIVNACPRALDGPVVMSLRLPDNEHVHIGKRHESHFSSLCGKFWHGIWGFPANIEPAVRTLAECGAPCPTCSAELDKLRDPVTRLGALA